MESASGSAEQGRDSKTQAIFALKGKSLNVCDLPFSKAIENSELSDLCLAIGAGPFTNNMTEEEIDESLKSIRYSKFIVLTDADFDGKHISCLLLTFFFKFMKPLIDRGMVFLSDPPLFRVTGNKVKSTYFSSLADLENFLLKFKNEDFQFILKKDNKDFILNEKSFMKSSFDYKKFIDDAAFYTGIAPITFSLYSFALKLSRNENCSLPEAFLKVLSYIEAEGILVTNLGAKFLYKGEFLTVRFCKAIEEHVEILLENLNNEILIYKENGKIKVFYEVINDIITMIFKDIKILYAKGLGELNPFELNESTLDVKKRHLKKITSNDFNKDGLLINGMMSSKEVEFRKNIIKEFQTGLENLDI